MIGSVILMIGSGVLSYLKCTMHFEQCSDRSLCRLC